MKIIELKCPNCGAKLDKLDKQNAICNHCGSVFVIKDIQKEQKKDVNADGGLQNRIFAWVLVMGIVVVGIFFFLLSPQPKAEESRVVSEKVAITEGEFQWSPFFEKFLEEVYGLPVEKISAKQLEEMTHLKIFYEKDCWVAEYRMEDGEIQSLEFSGELTVDYGDAGKLTGLKSLDVGRNDFAEGELTKLENLSEIWCSNTPEELMQIVSEPEKLTTMGCYWTSTVAMVDRFVNLEHLYIKSPGLTDKLTDISALSALKNLKRLELIDCDSVTDFGVLFSLTGLEELTIDSEGLKEISFVEKMQSLYRLKIESSIMLNVSPLQGKTSLRELALIDNYDVTDYDALSSLTGLEKLELELCRVSYMPDMSGLKKLKDLIVRGAEDISFLKDIPQLKSLYIANCDCSAYGVLAALQELEDLKMSGVYGNISSLDVLLEMKMLKSLDISGMSLYGNVQNIFGIPSLEKLDISDCSFGLDFETMPSNDNLRILYMDRMELWENIQVSYDGMITYLDYEDVLLSDHIDFLDKFPNLEELYMQDDKITDVIFAEKLPNLTKLDITGNYVTDMRPLSNLEHLEIVWCGENSISQGMDLGEDVIVVSDSEVDDGDW